MKSLPIALSVVLLGLGVVVNAARAQEIEATVTVNTDQLSPAAQQELAGFADEMELYINNMRWTEADWEGDRIKMNFNVVFTGSNDNSYSARLLVGSQRALNKSENFSAMMKILDDGWNFGYVRNQPFINDPSRYDPLTGLIDFYVNIAIGLDLDSYAYLGGATMYERAWTIAQRAQVRTDVDGWSTQESPGNYSRYGFIRELTEARFAPIRKFILDYHYNGLDLIADNRAAALDSVNARLSDLVIVKDKLVQPSVLLRMINDTKYVEFAELFTGYRDPVVWRKLLYLDPGHATVYEEAQNR
jgi:hypothetical protein